MDFTEAVRRLKGQGITLKDQDGRMSVNYRGGRNETRFYVYGINQALVIGEIMAAFAAEGRKL